MWSNGWTDWEYICTCKMQMNLGMNGHRLNKHGPKDTKGSILTWGYVGAIFGGLGGLIFNQNSGNAMIFRENKLK